MKKYLPILGLVCYATMLTSQNAWINEFHYDDAGSDTSEVVEIVIENPGMYTLSFFEILLYNGNGGTVYGSETGDNWIEGTTYENFTIYHWNPSSIQNGAPDGFALAYEDLLIQFISYEGDFEGTEGPAAGMISTDVGVSESSAPEGFSLQLSGTGSQYGDFIWQSPDTATTGELNNGQIFSTGSSSTASDIIRTIAWEEPVNIDYTQYTDTIGLGMSNSIQVGSFTIRDGGGGPDDEDEFPTQLNSLTLSLEHSESLAAIAIFDGTENLAEIGKPDSMALFAGIDALSAPDNGNKDFSIRVTFSAPVTDNANLKFVIHQALADTTGSSFAEPDAGGASTDDSGDHNRLVVIADRLAVNTPESVFVNTDFYTEVLSTDSMGSRDLDLSGPVTLALVYGDGILNSNSGLDQILTGGYFKWTDLVYDTKGQLIIEAQSGDLANALSDTIVALDLPTGGILLSLLCDPHLDYATDRFIQIYNSSHEVIDLTGWSIVAVANGADIFTWDLSGDILPGESKTCGDDENTRFLPDFAEADWSLSNNTWNGGSGDGARLMQDTSLVDDASGHGDFADKVSIRLPEVTGPEIVFVDSQWTSVAVEYVDDAPSSPDFHYCEAPVIISAENIYWSTAMAGYGNGASYRLSGVLTVDMGFSSPAICNHLTIEGGASLFIEPAMALTVRGNLEFINDGREMPEMVVKSNDSGNGSLIVQGEMPGQAIQVERYLPGYSGDEDGWHLISCPADTMQVSGSDFDPGTNDDLYRWNETDNIWDNYKDGGWDSPVFLPGSGYLVAFESDGMRTFSAPLVGASNSFSDLSLTDDAGEGWHLLGNPFPSAIEWGTEDWELNNIESASHVWNEGSGNYSLVLPGEPIPSTNGFFVKAASADNGITIPLDARVHAGVVNFKNTSQDPPQNLLQLRVTNNEHGFMDICRIGFEAQATDGYDVAYDVHKLFGKPDAPQLWTAISEEAFALNIMTTSDTSRQVLLHFKAGEEAHFTLQASGVQNIMGFDSILLEDLFNDKITDLTQQTFYDFEASPEDSEVRFAIHFRSLAVNVGTWPVEPAGLYIADGKIIIPPGLVKGRVRQVTLYNLAGQQVFYAQVPEDQRPVLPLSLMPGVYIARITSAGESACKKLLVN